MINTFETGKIAVAIVLNISSAQSDTILTSCVSQGLTEKQQKLS